MVIHTSDLYHDILSRVFGEPNWILFVQEPQHLEQLRIRISQDQCNIMHFIRLDFDDMINHDYISILSQLHSKDLKADHIDIVGSSSVHKLVLDTDGEKLLCSYELIRRETGYQFSIGQTVIMSSLTWNKFFKDRTMFGDHTKLKKTIESFNSNLIVRKRNLNLTSTYLVTRLSGHFPKHKIASCNFSDITVKIGNKSAELIYHAKKAIPDLEEKMMQENTFSKR